MYRLIKNELYKLFHKKSTFIILIIIFGMIVFTNVIYKYMATIEVFSYSDPAYIDNLMYEIDNFDTNKGNMSEYASLKASLEIQQFVENKENDWVVNKYYNSVSEIVYSYYENLYVFKDIERANILREQIDEYVKRLNNKDWEYFVNLELDEINNWLNNFGNQNLMSFDDDLEKEKKAYEYKKYLLEYRLENNVSFERSYLNTAIEILTENIYDKLEYEYAKTQEQKNNYKESYKIFMENEYIINHKVDTNNDANLRSIIVNFFDEYLFLILVFIVMISGSLISEEFNKGTIKSLLTLPYSRGQIFIAKFITVILMIPFVTLFILFAQLLVGGIAFGFSSLTVPVVAYNFKIGALEIMSLSKYFLFNFVGILPMLILLVTLAFALSTLLSNTAFAITVTFCGYIASTLINQFALYKDVEFLNYFVTTNWDLTYLLFGGTSLYNIPFGQSLIVCLIYFLIMIIVSFIVFKKKNIKNI